MWMVIQLLSPGMQNLDDPGAGSQILRVSGKFQKGMGRAGMHKPVKEFLVCIDQRIELGRNGEDNMEIRGVDYLRPALIDPYFLEDGLAVWAVTVTAGIGMGNHVSTIIADRKVVPQGTGFTADKRICRFRLFR